MFDLLCILFLTLENFLKLVIYQEKRNETRITTSISSDAQKQYECTDEKA